MISTIILTVVITLCLAGLGGGFVYFYLIRKENVVLRALNMRVLMVTLPKIHLAQGQNAKDLIAVMEHFYGAIHSFRQPGFKEILTGAPYFSLEIVNAAGEEEIIFYIGAPRRFLDDIEKQIHGIFPTASVTEIGEFNIFHPDSVAQGASLQFKKDSILPLKTYAQLQSDPMNLIASELTKLDDATEGAAVQILIRPASSEWIELSRNVVRRMKQGMKYVHAVSKERHKAFHFAGDALTELQMVGSSAQQKEQDKTKKPQPIYVEDDIVKALEEKQKKSGFHVNIRIVAAAMTEGRARDIMQHLGNAFAQYARTDGNEFALARAGSPRALKNLLYRFTFRIFDATGMILNTEELSSIFHLSTAGMDTPKVKVIRSKVAPPPTNLPKEGVVLGFSDFRGVKTDIRLTQNDRRRHLYIIGQTGTGKSSVMKNLIRQDIEMGNGVGLVDPHGEFVEYILGHIPKHRAEDVVLFEPADLARPFGLNMLEYNPEFPEQKTFIVNELMKIFDRLYDLKATGGPMFEQYTRNALLLLMDDPNEGGTLMDVPRVMADSVFRKRLIEKCRNVVVRDFWVKEAEKAGGEASLANFVPYITSKFNVFIANDYMRPIIGQSKTTLNFADIINNKKILLVNLAKGRLGEINSNLIGMIVVGKLTMAAFSRENIPEDKRYDFYLYLDEFQNVATDSISTILSEARKYRLCLTIAHQYVSQIPEAIKAAVFGNVGSMVVYRVGIDDAQFMVKQFEPIFDQNDIANIGNFQAHAKLLINNQTTPPFNISFEKPQEGHIETAQLMRELSRLKFGRDRAIVEEEIMRKYH